MKATLRKESPNERSHTHIHRAKSLARLAKFSAERGRRVSEFSKKNIKNLVMVGAGCLLLGFFGAITYKLFGHTESAATLRSIDNGIIAKMVSLRTPLATQSAIDLTAMGSVTIVSLISLVFVGGFALTKDYLGMLQLTTAAAGGGLWMLFLKGLVERERPDLSVRLVPVTGFSYPSGHSLTAAAFYLTFAFMAARHMDRFTKRAAVFGLASSIVALVATSRVYLGVHFPSDVLSGVLFGTSWAIAVEAWVAYLGRKSLKAHGAAVAASGLVPVEPQRSKQPLP